MLLNVNYIRTDINTLEFHYAHNIVDTDYTKKFVVVVSSAVSLTAQRTLIADGILEFIYDNYRNTSQCPFRNIKNLYDRGGMLYPDDTLRNTKFYSRHSKVMDKILVPVAIVPALNYFDDYVEYNTTTTAATTFTINTATTFPRFTYNLRIQ
jgi:esterase/lipase